MNGFASLSVLVVLMATCTICHASPTKRDPDMNMLVRGLQAFLEKRAQEGGNQGGQAQQEVGDEKKGPTPKQIAHRLKLVEDRLFLEKLVTTQYAYRGICHELMHWLHHHLRALGLAEDGNDEQVETPSQNVKRLLKRVLVRMERGDGASNDTSVDEGETTENPGGNSEQETTENPGGNSEQETTGNPGGNSEQETTAVPSSDESDEAIMTEEDLVDWPSMLASCWMWTISVYGKAPDYPTYLYYHYYAV